MKKTRLLMLLVSVCVVLVLAACAAPAPAPATTYTSPDRGEDVTSTSPDRGEDATYTSPDREDDVHIQAPTPAPSPEAEVFKFKFVDYIERGTAGFDSTQQWLDDLKVASRGALDFEHYGAGEIVSAFESFDAVSSGMAEGGILTGGYDTGKDIGFGYASGTPAFIMPNRDHFLTMMYHYGGFDILQEAWHSFNLHSTGLGVASGISVMMTTFPATTLADFEGKIIRCWGADLETLIEVGISATFIPMGEVYGSLEKGVVDGVIMGGPGFQADFSHEEVTGYYLTNEINTTAGSDVRFNLDAWNSLPEDLQMLITIASGELASRGYHQQYMLDGQALKKFKEAGITFVTLLPEEVDKLREASLSVSEKNDAESGLHAALTKIMKDYMRDNGWLD